MPRKEATLKSKGIRGQKCPPQERMLTHTYTPSHTHIEQDLSAFAVCFSNFKKKPEKEFKLGAEQVTGKLQMSAKNFLKLKTTTIDEKGEKLAQTGTQMDFRKHLKAKWTNNSDKNRLCL